MKRFVIALLTVALLVPAALAPADSKIKVVATIPDLADMARHIGGDLVDVSSIATGVENIHAVPMKPSFATILNRADIKELAAAAVSLMPEGILEALTSQQVRDLFTYLQSDGPK